MNIDLAVILCLVNEDKNRQFDAYAAAITAKMLQNCPEQQAFLERFDIHYYIADNPKDMSIARVVDADYSEDGQNLRKGKSFGVVLNKSVLSKLETEDELAFVLGHELSHIMYQKEYPAVLKLNEDEEIACDCNAVKLLDAGGYNLADINAIDALYVQNNFIGQRIRARKDFMAKNDYNTFVRIGCSTPLQKDTFMHLQKEPWCRENIFEFGNPGIDRIVSELKDIFEKGDKSVFVRGFDAFLNKRSTAESSQIIMSVLGRVMSECPSITEVYDKQGLRKYYNHPVFVMSNIVLSQFKREGKKLLPPKELAVVNRYMLENSFYFEQKDKKIWQPLRDTIAYKVAECGKEGR